MLIETFLHRNPVISATTFGSPTATDPWNWDCSWLQQSLHCSLVAAYGHSSKQRNLTLTESCWEWLSMSNWGGGQYHQNSPLPMDQNKGQIKKTETYCTLHISSEWGCIKTSMKGTQNWGRQASLIHWLLVQLYSELYSVEFGEVGTECCFCYTQNEWTLCEHCFGRFNFKYKFVSFFWDKLHSLWYVEIEKGEETLPCSLQEVVLIISLLIWKVNQPVLLSGERVARTDLKALLSWIYIEVGKWSGCTSRNVFHFDIGSLSFCFAYPGTWFQEQSSLIDLFLRMVVVMLLSC